jgi:DNA-binding transcriptional MerR regulator/methylmalonyl-CoA mutase cobalamin-binding subunit
VYRIRTVSRLTGLSPEVIRAWERRYGLIRPGRSTGRYRLYNDEEVRLLRGARALVDAGQAIGDVARLPREELLRAATSAPAAGGTATPGGDAVLESLIDEAVSATARFDADHLEAVIGRGAALLSPLELCRRLLLPILRAIGDAWFRGTLDVAMEHFGSALVRARIERVLADMPRTEGAPRLIGACPAGEFHEGALLAAVAHAAAAGWEVIYLGASVPDEQIFTTAERAGARLVALSITMNGRTERVQRLVEEIRRRRASGFTIRIVAGGHAVQEYRALFADAGVEIADDVQGPWLGIDRAA